MARPRSSHDNELRRQSQTKLSCQALLNVIEDRDFTSGVLRDKRKKKGQWPHLYAVLHNGHGYFFWDEIKSTEPFMDFNLQDTRVDEIQQEDEKTTFEFQLTNRVGRFIFIAPSQRELEFWLNGFRKEIQRAKEKNRTRDRERDCISVIDAPTSTDHYDEIHDVLPTLPDEFQSNRSRLRTRPVSENIQFTTIPDEFQSNRSRFRTRPVSENIQSTTSLEKRSPVQVFRKLPSPNEEPNRMELMQGLPQSRPMKCQSSSSSVASNEDELTNFADEMHTAKQQSRELVTLIKGQLACQKVDVIVNAISANMQLEQGAVSKSLLEKAGPGLQLECKRKYPKGIKPRELAETSGCRLNCKIIYHGTMSLYAGAASMNVIDTFMTSCLQTANESEFVSIAFPALGTGHLEYPKHDVANTMFSCVERFYRRNPNTSLEDVRFVVYEKDFATIQAFEEEYKMRQSGDNRKRQTTQFAPEEFVESANKEKRQFFHPLNRQGSSSAPTSESSTYIDMGNILHTKGTMFDPTTLSSSDYRAETNCQGTDEVFKMDDIHDDQDDVDIVEALFDYNAQKTDELTIEKGDIIIVIAKHETEWWTGIKGDDTGYFPVNHTRPVKKFIRNGNAEYLLDADYLDVISTADEKLGIGSNADEKQGVRSNADEKLGVRSNADEKQGVRSNADEKQGVRSNADEKLGGLSNFAQETNDCKIDLKKKAVPTVLNALNDDAIKTYLEILKEGTEKRNKIRVIILGSKQSGKSLLTKRLLKESDSFVKESNSLEIHALRCKATVKDGEWFIAEDYDNETSINERILRACCQNKIITKSEVVNTDKINLSRHKTFPRSMTYDNNKQVNIVRSPPPDPYMEMSKPDNECYDLCEIVSVEIEEEETVLIEIWDLPGDEESCYAYLSLFGKNALYIVTVNVTENMHENIDSGLTFWPEMMRCLNKTHSQEDDNLSVFIVGTFKDKFDGNDDRCLQQLKCQIHDCIDNRHHIKGYYVVSNVQELDDLDSLRTDIVMVSRTQAYWDLERPLRWIHLEKNLHKQMKLNVPVMSIEDMKDCVKKMFVPLNDDHELEKFLSYHHDNGTVVYLKCNSDYVILDPQWLANAMMLIISSAKSKTDNRKTKEWRNLREYGKLSQELIDEIFSRQTPDIVKYKNLILNLMIKCNTIVRPDVALQTDNLDRFEYGVPCMINHLPIVEIEKKFGTEFTKSSCLCLEFLFLPPTFMAHLLVTCTHLFNPVREKKKKKTGDERHLLFYQNVAVFEIDDTKCEKLMICRYRNVIQFQVWKWGVGRTRSYCSIKTKLLQMVDRLIEERSSMQIQYSIKVKCQYTEYDCLDGMVDFKIIQPNGKYYCDEHVNSHSSDEVHVDWCGESDEDECTNDQINAARMAIMILDILGDILYDLLVLDKPSLVKKRSECDITWLYSQLRNQNQHIPSRGIWGGEMKDIQKSAEKIGDDIERIRLIRNGMQHLSSFVLDDKEYFEKLKIIQKVVRRMENHNKKLKGTPYTDRVKEVAKRKLNMVDWETYKDSIEIELPRLTLKPSFDVKIGEGCTLDCEVIVALPKGASIYWVRMMGGQETRVIVDAMKYKGSEEGYPSLIILNSSKDDEGYYSCRIEYPVNCAESGDEELKWPKTFLHVH